MIETVRIPIIKRSQGYFLRWYYNGWHYWQFYPGALNYKTEGEKYRTYGTRSVTMSSGPLTEAQSEAVRTILNTREVYLYTDNGWASVRIETGQAEIKNTLTKGCEVTFKTIIGSRMLSVTGFSPVTDVPVVTPDDLCEVTIGTQIWMCKNWDANYPASKVYNDTEANRVIYGGLYTYDQVMSAGFVPEGWHVPTLAEWNTLLDSLGGFATAGGDLKTSGTTYWDSPNTGGDDGSGLSFKGSGFYMNGVGFAGLKTVANIWTASPVSSAYAYAIQLTNDDEDAIAQSINKNTYCAVRLVKDEVAPLTTVTIGTQTWKMTNVSDNIVGSKVYNDDEANRAIYGGLYLFSQIAAIEALYPGYHVPTATELTTLWNYASSNQGKLKEIGFDHWDSPNSGATDEYGFTALGAGICFGGSYMNIKTRTDLMSSSITGSTVTTLSLFSDSGVSIGGITGLPNTTYFPVRLIKD